MAFTTKFRSMMLKALMIDLYKVTDTTYSENMHRLANLHGGYSPAGNTNFKFGGKLFSYGNSVHGYARNLHHTLVPEMQILYDRNDRLDWEEKPAISMYLGQALLACQGPGDLLVVLPECIHKFIRAIFKEVEGDLLNEPSTIDPEVVLALNQKYSLASQLIKQRLLTNLIIK